MKEKYAVLFSITAASTVIVYLGLFTIYSFLDYLEIISMFSNKYYVVVLMISLGIINYILFIRSKKFLDYGFKKDIKGGVLILFYIFITAASFIAVANCNRAKIFEQQSELSQVEPRCSANALNAGARFHRVPSE